jgi:hypothetical protein
MYSKLKNLGNKIINGRNDFSPKVQNILKSVGDIPIQSAILIRYPLPSLLTTALNIINFKSQPFDKLFHLAIVLLLSTGTKVILEKNEQINMDITTNHRIHKGIEELAVNNISNKTINTILSNTKSAMGENKFYSYSAYDNNCQYFILNLLKSNNLETPDNSQWVKQNTEYIFQNNVHLRKLANTITDVAGILDVVKQGGELKASNNKISESNGLNTLQIDKMLKGCKIYNGIYSKDKLPKKLKEGWYIINMQNADEGNGTHWTCFNYSKTKPIVYYDSLGFPSPLAVCKVANNKLLWSNQIIQNDLSTACGYFCIACIKYDEKTKGDAQQNFKPFLKLFSSDTTKNDLILKHILSRLI